MKWNRERIHQLTGLAGVASYENRRARDWAGRLEWPMLFVAFWIPIQWYLESVDAITSRYASVGDWVVWLAFIIEFVVLFTLVADKRRYLLHNWMNLTIVVTGVFIVWGYTPVVAALRGLRLLLVLGLLVRISRTLTEVMQQSNLGNLLGFAFFMVVIAGVLMSGIDPAIQTPWQGIWWALVSITTVGYGDVVPVSGPGKVFAAILIVLGIIVFSLITANVSAFLIRRGSAEEEEAKQDALRDIQRRLERIEARLRKMDHSGD